MGNLLNARVRYKRYRSLTRELVEEEAFSEFRKKIRVVEIDDDVLRRAANDWYDHPNRRVKWDWEHGIIEPHLRAGSRGLQIAFISGDDLCALMVARVSRRKRWLSLTHLESAPFPHPLKGEVTALAVLALYKYRAVISEKDQADKVGIRVLNPLQQALHCYTQLGYTHRPNSKWLNSVVIEEPIGE